MPPQMEKPIFSLRDCFRIGDEAVARRGPENSDIASHFEVRNLRGFVLLHQRGLPPPREADGNTARR
jgi:hypothetical protein